jgi:hypothetical protein
VARKPYQSKSPEILQTHTQLIRRKSCVCLPEGDDEDNLFRTHRCYNAKDWIERRKRKQLVRRELHNLKPRLQLFSVNREFSRSNWRIFKRNYNVTSAIMKVLLEAPGEEFFSGAKQMRNKNRRIEELSLYAK